MISLKLVLPSQITVGLVFGCNQPLFQAIHYFFMSFLRLVATDKGLSQHLDLLNHGAFVEAL